MSDDLTRLTEQERARLNDYDSWEHHLAIIESILAARTAALLDRAERAERERDEFATMQREKDADMDRNWRKFKEAESELAALRAAVTGLADETGSAFPYVQVRALRALLTDEGDNG